MDLINMCCPLLRPCSTHRLAKNKASRSNISWTALRFDYSTHPL